MGILRSILGFDKNDIENLREKNAELEAKYYELIKSMKTIVEHMDDCDYRINSTFKMIESLEEKLEELREELNNEKISRDSITSRIEDIELTLAELVETLNKTTSIENNNENIDRIILDLIGKGVTTPSELVEKTGFSRGKIYASLRRLVSKGLLIKEKRGRNVYYLLNEGEIKTTLP